MRLTDLDPRWTDVPGVSFDCPHCRVERIAVPFNDGRWTRSGEGFEDLTIFPSINLEPGHPWHGWVQNGEVLGA